MYEWIFNFIWKSKSLDIWTVPYNTLVKLDRTNCLLVIFQKIMSPLLEGGMKFQKFNGFLRKEIVIYFKTLSYRKLKKSKNIIYYNSTCHFVSDTAFEGSHVKSGYKQRNSSPVWIRTGCLLNTSQQYDSHCIRFFPTKQFVNIFVNLFHLCLSNFDKTAITISEQVVQLAAVMRGWIH
jgi:hypothetical protein